MVLSKDHLVMKNHRKQYRELRTKNSLKRRHGRKLKKLLQLPQKQKKKKKLERRLKQKLQLRQ